MLCLYRCLHIPVLPTIMCSIALQRMQVSEIGLYSAGYYLRVFCVLVLLWCLEPVIWEFGSVV